MNSPTSIRTYVGRLEGASQAVYAVDADGVERFGSFGWGEDAPALARVLLTDAAGFDPGAEACGRFADEVLARLPFDGFSMQRDTVAAWVRRTLAVQR